MFPLDPYYHCDRDHTIYAYEFGDLDGDGDTDAVVAGLGALAWAENLGPSSGFVTRPLTDMPMTSTVRQVLLFDADNDGKLDVCVARTVAGITCWRNVDNAGTFERVDNAPWMQAGSIVGVGYAADINNDGHVDLLAQNKTIMGPLFAASPTILSAPFSGEDVKDVRRLDLYAFAQIVTLPVGGSAVLVYYLNPDETSFTTRSMPICQGYGSVISQVFVAGLDHPGAREIVCRCSSNRVRYMAVMDILSASYAPIDMLVESDCSTVRVFNGDKFLPFTGGNGRTHLLDYDQSSSTQTIYINHNEAQCSNYLVYHPVNMTSTTFSKSFSVEPRLISDFWNDAGSGASLSFVTKSANPAQLVIDTVKFDSDFNVIDSTQFKIAQHLAPCETTNEYQVGVYKTLSTNWLGKDVLFTTSWVRNGTLAWDCNCAYLEFGVYSALGTLFARFDFISRIFMPGFDYFRYETGNDDFQLLDLDNDGIDDLVLTSDWVVWCRGLPGWFAPAENLMAGLPPCMSTALFDMNGDLLLDIVCRDYPADMSWFENMGNDSFDLTKTTSGSFVSQISMGLRVVDVDQDGFLDLLLPFSPGLSAGWPYIPGPSSLGSFASPSSLTMFTLANCEPMFGRIADFTGDTVNDIICSDNMTWFQGFPNATFYSSELFIELLGDIWPEPQAVFPSTLTQLFAEEMLIVAKRHPNATNSLIISTTNPTGAGRRFYEVSWNASSQQMQAEWVIVDIDFQSGGAQLASDSFSVFDVDCDEQLDVVLHKGGLSQLWWYDVKCNCTNPYSGTCNDTSRNPIDTYPTAAPTLSPTRAPSSSPTQSPTFAPTTSPTTSPTKSPSLSPTTSPTDAPTTSPTRSPSVAPSTAPSASPTFAPTLSPTLSPNTEAPTTSPTLSPTLAPIIGTAAPTTSPTPAPTSPTESPTRSPTTAPTKAPTSSPTTAPSLSPTQSPTRSPTKAPVDSTLAPTMSPTVSPTLSPTQSPVTPQPTTSPIEQSIPKLVEQQCDTYYGTSRTTRMMTDDCIQRFTSRLAFTYSSIGIEMYIEEHPIPAEVRVQRGSGEGFATARLDRRRFIARQQIFIANTPGETLASDCLPSNRFIIDSGEKIDFTVFMLFRHNRLDAIVGKVEVKVYFEQDARVQLSASDNVIAEAEGDIIDVDMTGEMEADDMNNLLLNFGNDGLSYYSIVIGKRQSEPKPIVVRIDSQHTCTVVNITITDDLEYLFENDLLHKDTLLSFILTLACTANDGSNPKVIVKLVRAIERSLDIDKKREPVEAKQEGEVDAEEEEEELGSWSFQLVVGDLLFAQRSNQVVVYGEDRGAAAFQSLALQKGKVRESDSIEARVTFRFDGCSVGDSQARGDIVFLDEEAASALKPVAPVLRSVDACTFELRGALSALNAAEALLAFVGALDVYADFAVNVTVEDAEGGKFDDVLFLHGLRTNNAPFLQSAEALLDGERQVEVVAGGTVEVRVPRAAFADRDVGSELNDVLNVRVESANGTVADERWVKQLAAEDEDDFALLTVHADDNAALDSVYEFHIVAYDRFNETVRVPIEVRVIESHVLLYVAVLCGVVCAALGTALLVLLVRRARSRRPQGRTQNAKSTVPSMNVEAAASSTALASTSPRSSANKAHRQGLASPRRRRVRSEKIDKTQRRTLSEQQVLAMADAFRALDNDALRERLQVLSSGGESSTVLAASPAAAVSDGGATRHERRSRRASRSRSLRLSTALGDMELKDLEKTFTALRAERDTSNGDQASATADADAAASVSSLTAMSPLQPPTSPRTARIRMGEIDWQGNTFTVVEHLRKVRTQEDVEALFDFEAIDRILNDNAALFLDLSDTAPDGDAVDGVRSLRGAYRNSRPLAEDPGDRKSRLLRMNKAEMWSTLKQEEMRAAMESMNDCDTVDINEGDEPAINVAELKRNPKALKTKRSQKAFENIERRVAEDEE